MAPTLLPYQYEHSEAQDHPIDLLNPLENLAVGLEEDIVQDGVFVPLSEMPGNNRRAERLHASSRCPSQFSSIRTSEILKDLCAWLNIFKSMRYRYEKINEAHC